MKSRVMECCSVLFFRLVFDCKRFAIEFYPILKFTLFARDCVCFCGAGEMNRNFDANIRCLSFLFFTD